MSRPWVKYLLIVSLALNLLVLGAIAGMALRGGGGVRWGGGGAANMFAYISQLPKERRDALLRRGSELRPQLRALRDDARAAGREALQALSADRFDPNLLAAAQKRQFDAEARLRTVMNEATVALAGQMSPEERRAFVSWRGMRRMHGNMNPLFDDPAAPKKP